MSVQVIGLHGQLLLWAGNINITVSLKARPTPYCAYFFSYPNGL